MDVRLYLITMLYLLLISEKTKNFIIWKRKGKVKGEKGTERKEMKQRMRISDIWELLSYDDRGDIKARRRTR